MLRLRHYLRQGMGEGRDSGTRAEATMLRLRHYLRQGMGEGRDSGTRAEADRKSVV